MINISLHSKRAVSLKPATLVNLGVSGNNTDDIIARLSSVYSESPNLTTLLVGANDFLNSAKLKTLAQYEANINTIVSGLKSHGSQVLLLTIMPCIESYLYARHTYPSNDLYNNNTLNQILDLGNNILKSIKTSQNVLLADTSQLFKDHGEPITYASSWLRNSANSGTTDGLHPTPDGHTAISNFLFNWLKTNNKYYAKIACLGNSITYGANVATSDTWVYKLSQLLNA